MLKRLLVLLLLPVGASATVYRWPDVAPPCNTSTLQACIYAVGSGDTVQVQTSSTIDLSGASYLYVDRPLSLVAAPGYRPSLPVGATISAFANPGVGVNWNVAIEGFTLPDGAVIVQATSGNASVSLRRLDVTTRTQVSTVTSGLALRNNGSGNMTYEIAENRVQVAIDVVSQPPGIYLDSNGGGALSGRIHDNRVSSSGLQGMRGIAIYPQGASTSRVYANRISGNVGNGISMFPGNANFAHQFDAVSNAVDCNGAQGFPSGIVPIRSVDGSVALQVFNNTVVGCYTGITVSNAGSAGPLSGRIANNLIAYNHFGLTLGGIEALVSNDHNLLFGNTANNYTPGPGTVTSDPLLRRGQNDARLGAGSPAIDASDTTALRNLLTADTIGEIDADGSRRFKGAANLADIGAFEFGDVSFTQRATNTSSFVVLDNAALSGNASARPQVTTSREVDSYQTNGSLYYVRFDYGAPTYYLYTEGGVLHYVNSGFNIFVPAVGNGVLLHTTTAVNVSAGTTIIDDAYLNGHPERIVLAHHRGNGTVSSLNDAISAGYLISKWVLQRSAGINMPLGADFHVYAQDPSLNAFAWATPEVGDTSYTLLDQPVINGEPCAQIYAQQSGTANPHPTQLRYVSALKRWRIENADNTLLPNNTSFMVVVDEAATVACRYDHIFHDGVEVLD